MNKQYKRVEVQTEYGETLLIVNLGTYELPSLEVNYMRLTPLGELYWVEDYHEALARVLPEYQQEFKETIQSIKENKQQIYDKPDKELEIDGHKLKTIGIHNLYRYNH